MRIEVLKNDKYIGVYDADDFLETFNYDAELEELLNLLDNYNVGKNFITNIFGYELSIEKIADENIFN